MKEFLPLKFDSGRCANSLAAFGRLLAGKAELEENADVKPFFEAHQQLLLHLGNGYYGRPSSFDLYAFQYQLFGDFGCDLVVGDSRNHYFGFVELEDATAGSLFRQQGKKATPEWSTRLERGFSQVADWFWKLEDMSRSDEFQVRFGSRHADYFGLLVIGRDAHLEHQRERNRWNWRSRKVLVDGKPIYLATYDQLHQELSRLLEHFAQPPVNQPPPT